MNDPIKNPKFQIFFGSNGEYYFRLRAKNGKIILASEGYKQKKGCLNGIDSVKENAADERNFKKKESKDKKPYFVLLAKNNQVIGNSETYESKASRDNGIKAVMDVAPTAPWED